ncbi:hypothetical protein D6V18_17165 [Vibrio cholerae]|nr:hypothetical protein [Vibrio cholerae]EGR0494574.1 hypothetical protein [Vibrio cholerae]EGR1037251.1 hypothetical protein [Vibrio cholerae]KAA1197935.1 hypothetical protein F0M12_13480 [Vibrio cholerae]MVB40123.1 hypothetical protein [Vibrio cholerae]
MAQPEKTVASSNRIEDLKFIMTKFKKRIGELKQRKRGDVQLTVHFHSACFKETSVYSNHLQLHVGGK